MSKERPGKKTSRGFEGLAELKPVLEAKQMQQQSSTDASEVPQNAEVPQEERMTEGELLASLQGLSNPEVQKRIDEFVTFADKHDTDGPAVTAKYAELASTFNDTDRELFKSAVVALGWEVNERVIEGPVDLLALGNTAKEVRKHLGDPAGKVDGISYWLLPDGAAAMLSGGPPEHRKLQRWGEGGFQKIKGVYYEYKDGAFNKMTNEEGLAREKAMREAPQKPKARKKKAKGPESAKAKKVEAPAEVRTETPAQAPDSSHKFKRAFEKLDELRRTGIPRVDQVALASRGLSDAEFTEFEQLVKKRDKEREDQKKAEKVEKVAANAVQSENSANEPSEERAERKEARSFKDMHRIFNKKKRDGLKTGPAFKVAVEGQSLDKARKFKKELEEDGESHGLLEGAMRELEQRHKKEKTNNEHERTSKIEEMVEAMFSGQRRTVSETSAQSEQHKDMSDFVDRIFALNASSR